MVRLIITLALLSLLVGGAIWEQSFINQSYKRLSDDLDVLVAVMNAQVQDARLADREIKDAKIDTPKNIAKVEAMHEYWIKRERRLAMVTRHADLAQVSDALIYMKNFVKFGNAEEAFAGAKRLRYLIDAQLFNLGANVQNVV
jgi:hypothetical protein